MKKEYKFSTQLLLLGASIVPFCATVPFVMSCSKTQQFNSPFDIQTFLTEEIEKKYLEDIKLQWCKENNYELYLLEQKFQGIQVIDIKKDNFELLKEIKLDNKSIYELKPIYLTIYLKTTGTGKPHTIDYKIPYENNEIKFEYVVENNI